MIRCYDVKIRDYTSHPLLTLPQGIYYLFCVMITFPSLWEGFFLTFMVSLTGINWMPLISITNKKIYLSEPETFFTLMLTPLITNLSLSKSSFLLERL
jgi:hypothetical protein